MPKASVNGIELYYELHGPEDGEVLVLSNGIMMSTAAWGLQTPVLAKNMRVLLYDCRGMWQSDHPAGPYSMDLHAEDLAGLLNHLGIDKAHIGGISYGSEISMVFALKYPEMTKSLVVIDGVSEVDAQLRAASKPWLIAAERNDPELLLRTSIGLNYSGNFIAANEALLEASVARFGMLKLDSFAELMKAFLPFNITGRLSEIKAPTLVIVGEEDILKGRKYSQRIVDQIKHAEYVVLPGSGHASCIEKPHILNTLLTGWVLKQKSS
ncbi:MAG TPA: alpha/beta hydrolase [Bellilinea sp.]|nr:alpha/beta hydrolase [Bellilinea sp.]